MIQLCHHRHVYEVGDPSGYARDDRLTHWKCRDCGDTFPLIGDTDRWRPNVLFPNCVTCGHIAYGHEIVFPVFPPVSSDGSIIYEGRFGRCRAEEPHPMYFRQMQCSCRCYEPDLMPFVTELLGLEARRVIL